MANMLGQKGTINPPVMHDTAWQDMTRYEHLHEKLENATHEMEKANTRLVDDLNKKWAEKASKRAHKGYKKSKTPTKAKVYKLDYDRSSLGRFTKLTEKLQDKYKLQGACLVLDAYQKAKDHNVIDNRGQYLDIDDYELQRVFKAMQNIVKNDKHHLLDEAVTNYTNSLYRDPEISDYVANGNLSPEELADKADPDKSFGKEVKNGKTKAKEENKEKETKVMNQNVPKPTGTEKLVAVDKYNPQVKIKPKIAEGPDVPLINRNKNQATKAVEKSEKTEPKLPQIDIDKENDDNTYIAIKKKNIDYDKKVVALTFDDGPSKYTEKILDILKENDACGTFFVVGNKVEFYSDQIKRILKEGSEIGNHSYSHKWLNRLSKEEFQAEVNKTQDIVKKETGFTPKLFRPTYGGYSDKLKTYTDLTFVLWTVDSSDWRVKNTDKILNNILPNVKDGSIILMHDNHSYAVKALDDVIKVLSEKGYQFVTVSELLEIKNLREG